MRQREPVQFSNYMTGETGEDLYGPLNGSLGAGLTYGQL
jgi:hypothetical protein